MATCKNDSLLLKWYCFTWARLCIQESAVISFIKIQVLFIYLDWEILAQWITPTSIIEGQMTYFREDHASIKTSSQSAIPTMSCTRAGESSFLFKSCDKIHHIAGLPDIFLFLIPDEIRGGPRTLISSPRVPQELWFTEEVPLAEWIIGTYSAK